MSNTDEKINSHVPPSSIQQAKKIQSELLSERYVGEENNKSRSILCTINSFCSEKKTRFVGCRNKSQSTSSCTASCATAQQKTQKEKLLC